MNSVVIWITLAAFVVFYVVIEYICKASLKNNKKAFRHKCLKGTGEKLADKILEENSLTIEKIHKDTAFDDQFSYKNNRLYISQTGQKSDLMVAVNSVLRESYRAVLFNQNKGKYYPLYLINDILRTLTLIAIPLFFVGLIFKNNYILFGCLMSYFVLGVYSTILGNTEKKISALTNEYAVREKLFDKEGQQEFEKLNEVADVAPLYGTFNAFRQVNVILRILTRKKG